MLRLALSDLRDWRFRSIRFRTELTNPALCPFVALGELTTIAPANTANRKLRGTNLFIKTPLTIIKPFPGYTLPKNPAIISDD
jgi:hypothetical protein